MNDVIMVGPEALKSRETNTVLYMFMCAISVNSATLINVVGYYKSRNKGEMKK